MRLGKRCTRGWVPCGFQLATAVLWARYDLAMTARPCRRATSAYHSVLRASVDEQLVSRMRPGGYWVLQRGKLNTLRTGNGKTTPIGTPSLGPLSGTIAVMSEPGSGWVEVLCYPNLSRSPRPAEAVAG